MSASLFWLGRAALGLGLCAIFTVGRVAWDGGIVLLRRYVASLDGRLRFLRSKVHARTVLALQCLAGALIVLYATLLSRWFALCLLPIVALAPSISLERQRALRVSKIEQQIETWLGAIANALKASSSLGEAIASSTSLVGPPMSEEVDFLTKEYELGTPLDRALENLSDRIQSKTLSGAVLALNVARKSGGNLPEMLTNAAAALRELARLEGVVRSKTAEGKAQTFVIGAIPVPMVLGIHWLDPGFFAPLEESLAGNAIVGGALVLWLIAILWARKIVAIDV